MVVGDRCGVSNRWILIGWGWGEGVFFLFFSILRYLENFQGRSY